jgi:hypothetical protein
METVQSQRSAQATTRPESFPGEEALTKLRQALEIEVRGPPAPCLSDEMTSSR